MHHNPTTWKTEAGDLQRPACTPLQDYLKTKQNKNKNPKTKEQSKTWKQKIGRLKCSPRQFFVQYGSEKPKG